MPKIKKLICEKCMVWAYKQYDNTTCKNCGEEMRESTKDDTLHNPDF